MALCRCSKHTPNGRKHNYNHYAKPIGYPNTSSICGKNGCNAAGFIWLTDSDITSFNRGERIFGITTHNGTKMKIQDTLYDNKTVKPSKTITK